MKYCLRNFLVVLVSIFIVGCSGNKEDSAQNKAMPPLKVKVFLAKKSDVPLEFEYPANVISDQSVDIVAKVPGELIAKYFKAGDTVKAGDKLFLIEQDKYKAVYDSAYSAVEVAKAKLSQFKFDYDRAEKLKKSGAISQKEYEIIISNYQIALANIKSAEAALTNAKVDLGHTVIKAPFDGILGDPYNDVGTYIQGANSAMVKITKLNPLYARFSISEDDALKMNRNLQNKEWSQKGAIATININGVDTNGTIIFIDKVINPKTGSIEAKAEFDNSKQSFLPGTFAKVKMGGFFQKSAFVIPKIAVLQDFTKQYVYIIKDGKATKNNVTVVSEDPTNVVVLQGLVGGEKIILNNFLKIRSGTSVVEDDSSDSNKVK